MARCHSGTAKCPTQKFEVENGNELLVFGVGTQGVVLWPEIGASQQPPGSPLRRQTRLLEAPQKAPK